MVGCELESCFGMYADLAGVHPADRLGHGAVAQPLGEEHPPAPVVVSGRPVDRRAHDRAGAGCRDIGTADIGAGQQFAESLLAQAVGRSRVDQIYAGVVRNRQQIR